MLYIADDPEGNPDLKKKTGTVMVQSITMSNSLGQANEDVQKVLP